MAARRNLNATRWKASSKLHGWTYIEGAAGSAAATLEVPTASVPSSWGRHFDGYLKVLGRTSRNEMRPTLRPSPSVTMRRSGMSSLDALIASTSILRAAAVASRSAERASVPTRSTRAKSDRAFRCGQDSSSATPSIWSRHRPIELISLWRTWREQAIFEALLSDS